jgi:hypothetical protein
MEQKPAATLKDRFWTQATRTDVIVSLVTALLSTGILTSVAQRWAEVTGGSWPASIFIGLGATCVLAVVVSVYMIAFRLFKPIPKSEEITVVGTSPAVAQVPLQRFTAALQTAELLEHKFDQAVEKIETFIAEAKIRQDSRDKLVGQIRSSLNGRRRLEQADSLFAEIEQAYAKIEDPDKIDWDHFTRDNNTVQLLIQRYYNSLLENEPEAKDMFLVTAHQMSPSFWRELDSTKFRDREAEHKFKKSRIWFVNLRTIHLHVRSRCERQIDFEIN